MAMPNKNNRFILSTNLQQKNIKLKTRLYIAFSMLSLFLSSQNDSVMINELNPFTDGLYLTNNDHRYHKAITKDKIITPINKDQVDFFAKVTSGAKVDFLLDGNTTSIDPINIWGFVQNNTLFVNFKGVFYRVPVFGAISYFAGVVEVTGYYTGIYDPVFGMGTGRPIKTKEVNEFLVSYYNGKVIPFDLEQLELLLKNDETVYKEFKSLSRRKRRKQITRFIRMYNDRHPVYVLK